MRAKYHREKNELTTWQGEETLKRQAKRSVLSSMVLVTNLRFTSKKRTEVRSFDKFHLS
ncbi:hypothetical protein PORCRE_1504 [Porphyromonas crevioricanis JCM 15906]|uniref:Uncharacterized protein n=1 Tax=Porphyromonas crevioricanis JCM 15906 TaxID=1305617 RepID=T1CI86_9PORP|nr:hypothetical protein PORCRE_1504 [Porphyromonas crevioricanis JCM 15906]GAD07541.1 hypothetical protein PORCAN_1162 [Porphyromonas crevioricanis JCM 13913]